MDNKMFVKEAFNKMFGASTFDIKVLNDLIHPEYIQHVDGKKLGFNEFAEHLKALKDKTQSIEVKFKTLIQEGDIVFSNHTVAVTMKDNSKAEMHVIAEFHIKSGKLFYCDELTALIDGDSANKNLGSVR